MRSLHNPVMSREIIEIFMVTEKAWFIDCTVGPGGHSRRILESFPQSKVVAVDMDEDALSMARQNLKSYGKRVTFFHSDFKEILDKIDPGKQKVSGVLVDPGLSMAQIKDRERGFSHYLDGPLDMRKDRSIQLTAKDVINTFSEERLSEIFFKYGEVKRHREIAKRIIEKRLFQDIQRTVQLTKIIEDVYQWHARKGKLHPAAKVFQALRIFINNELEGLESFLMNFLNILRTGARFVFLSYHSLEDRVVKRCMKLLCTRRLVSLIKPFPMYPSRSEISENLSARSVRLRAGEVI